MEICETASRTVRQRPIAALNASHAILTIWKPAKITEWIVTHTCHGHRPHPPCHRRMHQRSPTTLQLNVGRSGTRV